MSDDADIIGRVRGFIMSGAFRPGDRLPAERHLIGELGMPRGALRRALDALEREGLIWRHVGKGTFLARDGAASESGVVDWTIDVARQITPLRMVRARLCIEPALAGEAALNASAEKVARMRIALDRASAASNWEDYKTQDDLFHRAIAEASDNELLVGLFDQLNRVRRAVAFGVVTRDTPRPAESHSSFAEHEAIAAAIERRDRNGAQEAMRSHLISVSKRLFAEE
ncbi:MAG: FCD domain-containing protein [Roseobacter sp.]|nr:FCD domain-containing protein [Roseobacter sp.]